jgi:hypothetical protein
MPPPPKYRRRRPGQTLNKNELKVSRGAQEEQNRSRAGTLRQRFSYVQRLNVELKMETASGAVLTQAKRAISPDETLTLDLSCEGGCGNGMFLLKDAVEELLKSRRETREGLALCQARSYMDPALPCGTKLYYRFDAAYDAPVLDSDGQDEKENTAHE